ncbi:hypothetical protein BU16DRAFT_583004 [Lophium mytilinum]|uniref:Uncharacterized protein n=1 Tax=Lophium mytilinum TaxID=390894 RepID=A0A6A6QNC4_9PEZI|nr:hypothetical protein BU16DRAFT_583004 [Lophium mytilinum]
MVLDTTATAFAGTLFGASLTVSGVWLPEVIIGQFQLHDFHMIKAFLVGSAISAIVLPFFERNGLLACKPKGPTSLGWFHRYDGNILGGLLQGVSMALTGACPGTLVPQILIGYPSSARFVLLGGVLGGVLFTHISPWLYRSSSSQPPISPISCMLDDFAPFQNGKSRPIDEITPSINSKNIKNGRSEPSYQPPPPPTLPILPENISLPENDTSLTIPSVLDPIIDICDSPLNEPPCPKHSLRPTPCPLTIPALFNLDPNTCLLAYLACVLAILSALSIFAPAPAHKPQTRLNAHIGGLAIGAAQLATAALIRLPVGMSLAYEEAGAWLWHLFRARKPAPRWKALTFAGGMAIGSFLCTPWAKDMLTDDGVGVGGGGRRRSRDSRVGDRLRDVVSRRDGHRSVRDRLGNIISRRDRDRSRGERLGGVIRHRVRNRGRRVREGRDGDGDGCGVVAGRRGLVAVRVRAALLLLLLLLVAAAVTFFFLGLFVAAVALRGGGGRGRNGGVLGLGPDVLGVAVVLGGVLGRGGRGLFVPVDALGFFCGGFGVTVGVRGSALDSIDLRSGEREGQMRSRQGLRDKRQNLLYVASRA